MNYFKGVLIGLGTVVFGTPIALLIWSILKSQKRAVAVSFSPVGLASHVTHSPGFWVLIIVLFTAGFVPSVLSPKR